MVGFHTGLRRFPSRRSRRLPARSRCRRKRGAVMTGAVGPPRITGHKSAMPLAFVSPRGTIPTFSRTGWKARYPRWSTSQIDCWPLHASGADRSASSRLLVIDLDRLVRSVVHRHEEAWCETLLVRLPSATAAGLDALLKAPHSDATGGKGNRAPSARPPRWRRPRQSAKRRRGSREARLHPRACTASRPVR